MGKVNNIDYHVVAIFLTSKIFIIYLVSITIMYCMIA